MSKKEIYVLIDGNRQFLEVDSSKRYYFCNNSLRGLNNIQKKAIDRIIRILLSKNKIINIEYAPVLKINVITPALKYLNYKIDSKKE